MSGDLRPVGATFSDADLFGSPSDLPVPRRTPERVIAALSVAFRSWRAAQMRPEFGFDQADTERVWGARLAGYAPEAIVEAANEILEGGESRFPDMNEFVTLVASIQRRRDYPPAPARKAGEPCGECDDGAVIVVDGREIEIDSEGWVVLTAPDAVGPSAVRPCSRCRPEQHAMWERGHYAQRKTGEGACRCFHDLCPDQQRRQRAKR